MARVAALLAISSDAAPQHLQRLSLAALDVVEELLRRLVDAQSAGAQLGQRLAAQAAKALWAQGAETGLKAFSPMSCLCHGLRVLDLLWSCAQEPPDPRRATAATEEGVLLQPRAPSAHAAHLLPVPGRLGPPERPGAGGDAAGGSPLGPAAGARGAAAGRPAAAGRATGTAGGALPPEPQELGLRLAQDARRLLRTLRFASLCSCF